MKATVDWVNRKDLLQRVGEQEILKRLAFDSFGIRKKLRIGYYS